MKKVLIITYYWPPASGPGVQRWLKFVKYLPNYGWLPVILTVDGGSHLAIDEKLLKEVSEEIAVYRTKTLEPFGIYNRLRGKSGKQIEVGAGAFTADKSLMRRIGTYIRSNYFIPDARKGWNRFAIRKAAEIIKSQNIQYVVTTSPPHSSQLIGIALKKKFNIKWLADLRDPWISMMYNQFLTRTASSQAKDQAYEDQVLKTADQVTVIGPSMQKEFADRAKRIAVVTNGYDVSDIEESGIQQTAYEKFTLFFMGNFISQQSIPAFWQALHELCEKHPQISSTFQFLIIGNISEVVQKDMAKYNIGSIVVKEAFQPHAEVVKKLKRSHLLYLPIPETAGNEMIITGKIFEYLASRIPILSMGPVEGDASSILDSCERDRIIAYSDAQKVFNRIEEAWKKWLDSRNQELHQNNLHERYQRDRLTESMAKILDQL